MWEILDIYLIKIMIMFNDFVCSKGLGFVNATSFPFYFIVYLLSHMEL